MCKLVVELNTTFQWTIIVAFPLHRIALFNLFGKTPFYRAEEDRMNDNVKRTLILPLANNGEKTEDQRDMWKYNLVILCWYIVTVIAFNHESSTLLHSVGRLLQYVDAYIPTSLHSQSDITFSFFLTES